MPATAMPAAAAWDWRSCESWSNATRAWWLWTTDPEVASGSASRFRLPTCGRRAGRSELTNTQSFIATKRSTVTPRLASVSTTTSAPRLGELTACSSQSDPVVAASPAAKMASPCT